MKKSKQIKETPHSNYHWNGSQERFFEGWYLRVTLPEIKENFAFMYSIDDPCGGKKHSGGAVQIIGINEEYLTRTFPDTHKFWASKKKFALTHWGKNFLTEKPQFLPVDKFSKNIQEGYQVSTTLNQGFIHNPSNNKYCRWKYHIKPIYTWGDINQLPKATAGLLSFLPIYDPGWQVLMASGLATGFIDWNGEIYRFQDVPAYGEKNWGYSFPEKWFWLNCNSFNQEKSLAVTSAGGKRKILWWNDEVAMVGIHYQGKFYQFISTENKVNWQVNNWGKWQIEASNNQFEVKLIGTTKNKGTYVRVPTDKGLIFACRDTLKGDLCLELKDKNGKVIVRDDSSLCGLEIGG